MKRVISALVLVALASSVLILAGCGGHGSMTKEQWRAKLNEHYEISVNKVWGSKSAPGKLPSAKIFQQIMGKPSRTQVVGEETLWYYECSDGQFQIVIKSGALESDNIYSGQVNEY